MLKRLFALAALILVMICPLAARAESPDDLTGKAGLPFNEIAFAKQDGKTQFRSFTAQHDDGDVSVTSNLKFEDRSKLDLYVNGKKVTDEQLEQWVSKTVDARVRIDEETESLYFFGGKTTEPTPATGAPAVPVLPACPGGKCPQPRRID